MIVEFEDTIYLDETKEQIVMLKLQNMDRDLFLAVIDIIKRHGGWFIKEYKKWVILEKNYRSLMREINYLYEKNIDYEKNVSDYNEIIIKKIKENIEDDNDIDKNKEEKYNDEFVKLRKQLTKMQNGKCFICSSVGKNCHHIIPVKYGGENTLENLAILCNSCHGKIHSLYNTVAISKCYNENNKFFLNILMELVEKYKNA